MTSVCVRAPSRAATRSYESRQCILQHQLLGPAPPIPKGCGAGTPSACFLHCWWLAGRYLAGRVQQVDSVATDPASGTRRTWAYICHCCDTSIMGQGQKPGLDDAACACSTGVPHGTPHPCTPDWLLAPSGSFRLNLAPSGFIWL